MIIAGLADSLLNFRGPLIKEILANGHEVTACAPGEDAFVEDRLREWGAQYRSVRLDRTGLNPFRDGSSYFALERLIRGLKPDTVFSYTIKPVIFGSIAARLRKVPHIYSMITGLGYIFMGDDFNKRVMQRVVGWLYRYSLKGNDRVFFQNSDDLSYFQSSGILTDPGKAVLVNGSGVDLEHYAEAPIPTGKPVFLFMTRLIKEKGVYDYVDAARILKKRYSDVSFRLLGPFDSKPSAIRREQINKWESEDVIEYLGFAKDVRPHIANSTVYVFPSYREGIPRSVLEAMSMGRPVITTDVPGCRETVVPGKNGLLVPEKNPIALAECMEHFIKHKELADGMGQASREIAVDKFDVRKVNKVMLDVMGLSREACS